jgi:hypothetical protein
MCRADNNKKIVMNTDTQSAYVGLASNFYATRMQGVELNELNIIGALLRAAPDYRPDYYRRLRNALAFDQKRRGNFWAAQEINRTLNPVTVLGLPRKQKQQRPQKLSTADFEAWLRYLAERDMPVEAGALMVISLTGARPCELNGISIDGRRIHVSGAKLSHNGLRGASRTLEADDGVCNILRDALAAFKCQPRSMDSIRVALHQVATELFGRRKVPSMYTLRHQFGANLKASGMSAVEMAYVMGHQATDSISRYGDRRTGRAEAVKVKPASDADFSKVRDTVPTRMRAVELALSVKRDRERRSEIADG